MKKLTFTLASIALLMLIGFGLNAQNSRNCAKACTKAKTAKVASAVKTAESPVHCKIMTAEECAKICGMKTTKVASAVKINQETKFQKSHSCPYSMMKTTKVAANIKTLDKNQSKKVIKNVAPQKKTYSKSSKSKKAVKA